MRSDHQHLPNGITNQGEMHMEGTSKDIVTKQDIIDYVTNMKIKRGVFGGLDKADVYYHIQEIVRRYDTYLGLKLEDQKIELMKQYSSESSIVEEQTTESDKQNIIDDILGSGEQAIADDTTEEVISSVVENFEGINGQSLEESATQDVDSQSIDVDSQIDTDVQGDELDPQVVVFEELDRVKQNNAQLQEELDQVTAELKSIQAAKEAEEQTQVTVTEDSYVGARQIQYRDEIQDILREARTQADRIVAQAHDETEREMVKVLQLRALYKQDQQLYKDWCTKIEVGKRTIEDFIGTLNSQYNMVNQALVSMKEGTESNQVNDFLLNYEEHKDEILE